MAFLFSGIFSYRRYSGMTWREADGGWRMAVQQCTISRRNVK
jgi:hypothetical protein